MVSNKNKVTVDSILAKLSPEEKEVFEQAQRSVEAKAKKKSVQRRLDDEDRKRIQECLSKVGCEEKKLALHDARKLALRWVLTNHAEAFCQYIKSFHGGTAKPVTDEVNPQTFASYRQNVQQGSYKSPTAHGNQ